MLNNYTPELFISAVNYYIHLSPMFTSEFNDINKLMTAINAKDKNKTSFINSSLLNKIFTNKKKDLRISRSQLNWQMNHQQSN